MKTNLKKSKAINFMRRVSKNALLSVLLFILFIPVIKAHAAFGVQVGGTGGDKNVQYGFGVSYGNLFNNSGGSTQMNGAVGIGNTILYLINGVLTPLIFAVAFITFLWGIYRYFIAGGDSDEGQKKGKQLMLYGIIGFVVMVSLWGLVNVVATTFGLAGWNAPAIPSSY